ncbi:MAG: LacI family DNA-binding transcriptional regulator [Candidatus Omnitrophota bacterium]|nr:MAG: LacI family DNA-binding transcriptional regulator [Candidatus Omnitrophota bacterium]
MRISQIAKKAGVSSMVVSRVMKGSPTIKKADRERVERAIGQMKLKATIVASTRQKISRIFGLVVPRFEDIFHSFYATEVIKGVSIAASRLKLDIMFHITDRQKHEDWLTSTTLSPDYIDGVLFADINGDIRQLNKVIARKIPYIVMNNYFERQPVNCIAVNNRKAAEDVIEYLIGLGHTKIATIAGDLSTAAGKARLDGFKRCMKRHNLLSEIKYIKVGHFLRGPARREAERLLNLSEPPTAIFCASDVMAMETMNVAKEKGLHIPEDLSIIGFDDNPIAAYAKVPLTTVWQPIVEMGREAVELLNQMLDGKRRQPVKILLDTKLIKRKSCAPPKR